jgi:hypothetical protein
MALSFLHIAFEGELNVYLAYACWNACIYMIEGVQFSHIHVLQRGKERKIPSKTAIRTSFTGLDICFKTRDTYLDIKPQIRTFNGEVFM